jgi:hypothetical protein
MEYTCSSAFCDFVYLTDADVHLLQLQIRRQPVTDFQERAEKRLHAAACDS